MPPNTLRAMVNSAVESPFSFGGTVDGSNALTVAGVIETVRGAGAGGAGGPSTCLPDAAGAGAAAVTGSKVITVPSKAMSLAFSRVSG